MKQLYLYTYFFLFLFSAQICPAHVPEHDELGKIQSEENHTKAPRPSLAPGGFVSNWSQLPDLTPLITQIVQSVLASSPSSLSSGNVNGPVSSTVDAVPRFANTLGTLLKNSSVLVDDLGNITIEGITKNGNTVSWPTVVGAAGTFLSSDGSGNLIYATPAGGGNVSSALPFSTNNAITTVDLLSGVKH